MAKVYVTQAGGSGGSVATGVLQLSGGAAMTSTLTAVTDQNNTASPLKLSTTGVQTLSTLKITTSDNPYIDAEDGAGNNRFQVGREPSSQVVNIDFASNPTGGTNQVGAIRTYTDGVNLAEVMSFRKDGNIGIGTTTPGVKLDVHASTNVVAQFNRTGAGKSWIQFLQAGAGKWNVGYDNTNGNYTIYDVVNSTDRMVVTNAGNVGIGTSAPNSLLNVIGTGSGIRVNTGGGDSWIPYIDNNWYIRSSGTIINDNGTGGVSIGVNSPTTARLFVKGTGSTSATTALLVQNSTGLSLMTIPDGAGRITFGIDIEAGTFFGQVYIVGKLFLSNSGSAVFGNDSLDASAVLQANSTTKGFLPPRMTNAQRLAIATPAVGLMVYCTDAVEGLYIYKSTGWTFII